MLRFEFIQPGEFDDPEYFVNDADNDHVGYIYFIDGEWLFTTANDWCLSYDYFDEISAKLKQLNGVK